MSRPALEVADIFRDHGAAWRRANAGHVSLDQMKVMSAIEHCRTAALGGHVAREGCAHTVIAYNSCLMGKFRNGDLAAWLDGNLTAFRVSTLINVPFAPHYKTVPPEIAALRDRALGDTGYSECLFVEPAPDTTETCMGVVSKPSRPCCTASAQKKTVDLQKG